MQSEKGDLSVSFFCGYSKTTVTKSMLFFVTFGHSYQIDYDQIYDILYGFGHGYQTDRDQIYSFLLLGSAKIVTMLVTK